MGGPGESLVAQAVGGDDEALAELLERSTGALVDQFRRRIGRRWRSLLDVDDVMQVTYLEAYLRMGQFVDRGPGSFQAWLTRIAENNLRDATRELGRAKRPPPARQVTQDRSSSCIALLETVGYTTTTPSREAATAEATQLLEVALARLPEDYGQVLRLYDLEGRSIAEVASTMSRSPGAVHMLRARARDRLREFMDASGSGSFIRGP